MKAVYSNWGNSGADDGQETPPINFYVSHRANRRKSVTDSRRDEVLSLIRHAIVGKNNHFVSPFSEKQHMTFCDLTNRSLYLSFIETWMNRHVKPYFTGGKYTTVTGMHTNRIMTMVRHQIVEDCNCILTEDSIFFCKNGVAGCIKKLLHIMNVKPSEARNRRDSQHIVFIGPHDPLGTLLSFKKKGFKVIQIPENLYGQTDLSILEEYLKKFTREDAEKEESELKTLSLSSSPSKRKKVKSKRVILGCFSMCSPLNGMVMNGISITQLLHQYGALSIFDYSVGASVMNIEMNSKIGGVEEPVKKDAIFFDSSNCLGAPDGVGILIIKKKLYAAKNPYFYNHEAMHFFKDPISIRPRTDPTDSSMNLPSMHEDNKHNFSKGRRNRSTFSKSNEDCETSPRMEEFLEHDCFKRENNVYFQDFVMYGSTHYEVKPQIGEVQTGLSFKVKQWLGVDWIWQASNRWSQEIRRRLSELPNVVVLGGDFGTHITLVSFLIRFNSSYFLHHKFVSTLLNDLFGIQSGYRDRGITKYQYLDILGCDLRTLRKLNVFLNRKNRYATKYPSDELQGIQEYDILRPGWVTMTLQPHMAAPTFEFVIRAIEFIAREGWKFLVDYRHDDQGEYFHEKYRGITGLTFLDSFDKIAKMSPSKFSSLGDSDFDAFMNHDAGSEEEQYILSNLGGGRRKKSITGKKDMAYHHHRRKGGGKKKNRMRSSNNNLSDEDLWRRYERNLQMAEIQRKEVEERVMGREEGDPMGDFDGIDFKTELISEEFEALRWFLNPLESYKKLRRFDPIGNVFEDEIEEQEEEEGEELGDKESSTTTKKKKKSTKRSVNQNQSSHFCWISPKKYESGQNSPLTTFHPPTIDATPPSIKIGVKEPQVSSSFRSQKSNQAKKYYKRKEKGSNPRKRPSNHYGKSNRRRLSNHLNNMKRKSVDESQYDAKRRRSVMEMQIKRAEEEKIHGNKYFNFRRKSKVVIPSGITLHIEDSTTTTATDPTEQNGMNNDVDESSIMGKKYEYEDQGDIVFSPEHSQNRSSSDVNLTPNDLRRNSRVAYDEENEIRLLDQRMNGRDDHTYQSTQNKYFYHSPQQHVIRRNSLHQANLRKNNRRGRVYNNRKVESERINRISGTKKRKNRQINRTKNINVAGFYRRNHNKNYRVQKRYIPSLYTVGTRLKGGGGGGFGITKLPKFQGEINYIKKLNF